MTIRPITINENVSNIEFKSHNLEDISVITGGYIITPHGEIILVEEDEEHCNVFSEYINSYLENNSKKIYDTFAATKILCDLGCCVYAGIRYKEYILSKSEETLEIASLTFPNSFDILTSEQKNICKRLIDSNKSLLGDREKIYIQYGSFPDNVYSKEEILTMLSSNELEKGSKK